MNADEPTPDEDAFASLAADLDEALAAGQPLTLPLDGPQRLEERPRLWRVLDCLQRLERLWPRHDISLPASALAGAAAFPVVPGYEILNELGRGGMGVVYRARQIKLGRLVALKMILAGGHAGAQQRDRFRAEAMVVARLQHPNIVQIYEVGEHDGQPYFSLELVEGGSLDKTLKATLLPARESARLLEKLARAMHAAHQSGVIHRDLKPANVLLTRDGQPKITDFGLAKQLDSGAGRTRTGDLMGTPNYMAPEQAMGQVKEFGPATDVYALGAILYEMLTGRPPFRSDSAMDTLLMTLSEEPVPPGRLNPKVPRDLETICLKCLEKKGPKRYASAEALAEDLHRFLAGEPIRARPIGRGERLLKWARRRPAAAGLLTVSLLAALTLLGTILVYNEDLRKQKNIAEANAKEARLQEGQARLAQQLAEDAAFDLRRRVYGADIHRAYEAWFQGKVKRALTHLESLRPPPGQPDLRGFEWNFLANYSHLDQRTLAGPGGLIRVLTWLPGGKGLLATNGAGGVCFWDAAWKERRLTLAGHTGTPRPMAVSPDGRVLAEGYMDGMVKLWSLASGKPLVNWKAHPNGTCSLAFSPDGRTLATGGFDFTLNLWDARDGTKRAGPWLARAEIKNLSFSPDGARIAGTASDMTVRIWETATGTEQASFRMPGFAYCLAFTPDGKTLAAGTDGLVRLWDLASRKEQSLSLLPSALGMSLAFSGNGKKLAVGTGFGPVQEIQVWRLEGKWSETFLRGHTGDITALAFNGNDLLASASADGTVKVWDLGPKRRTISHYAYQSSSPINAVAFDRSGRTLAIAAEKAVQLWDVQGRRVRATLADFSSPVMTVAFSPDGKLLATGEGGWPALLQAKDPKLPPGLVKLWDPATGKLHATLKGHTHGIFSVAFSPDGRTLASGSWDQTVRLWDRDTGKERKVLKGHPFMVRSVAFSPDGKLLAAACGDRWINVESEVRLWDVDRTQEAARLMHSGPVYSVAFSPDGKTLAAAVLSGAVKLWDVRTRTERLSLETATPSQAALVMFSPDGRTVVSGHLNGKVHLWHEWTGQDIVSLAHSDGVSALAFSPNGHWLASADRAGTVLLWDGSPPAGSEATPGGSLSLAWTYRAAAINSSR